MRQVLQIFQGFIRGCARELKRPRGRALLVSVIIVVGCMWLLSSRYSVPILMYHDFGDSPYQGDLLSVTPERFEQQMAFLKEHAYTVISLDELVEGIKAGKKFAHKTVVITMDDGIRTNYAHAFPVLKKYGFPATIFLATNRIEKRDPEYLTWEQVKEMSQNGISFGGHTRGHSLLPTLKDKKFLWDEVFENKRLIERHVGVIKYFCYPVGAFTEEIKALVREAGYEAAVATNGGKDLSNTRDLYELHRVSIRNGDGPLVFWAKISGYYNSFRKARGSQKDLGLQAR